jgi:hypothetical protein
VKLGIQVEVPATINAAVQLFAALLRLLPLRHNRLKTTEE